MIQYTKIITRELFLINKGCNENFSLACVKFHSNAAIFSESLFGKSAVLFSLFECHAIPFF